MKQIKSKGFSMTPSNTSANEQYVPIDFNKIKIGAQSLKDATLTDISPLKKIDSRLADKETILKAIAQNDIDTMRDVSNFFYRVSGIYQRLCRYLAYMYRYD